MQTRVRFRHNRARKVSVFEALVGDRAVKTPTVQHRFDGDKVMPLPGRYSERDGATAPFQNSGQLRIDAPLERRWPERPVRLAA